MATNKSAVYGVERCSQCGVKCHSFRCKKECPATCSKSGLLQSRCSSQSFGFTTSNAPKSRIACGCSRCNIRSCPYRCRVPVGRAGEELGRGEDEWDREGEEWDREKIRWGDRSGSQKDRDKGEWDRGVEWDCEEREWGREARGCDRETRGCDRETRGCGREGECDREIRKLSRASCRISNTPSVREEREWDRGSNKLSRSRRSHTPSGSRKGLLGSSAGLNQVNEGLIKFMPQTLGVVLLSFLMTIF